MRLVKRFVEKKSFLLQLIPIILIFFFSVILVNTINIEFIKEKFSPLINNPFQGELGLYILINALLYLFLFPSTVLGASTGILFGFFYGSIVYIVSCLISSIAAFFLSRYFLKPYIQKQIALKGYSGVPNIIEKEGFKFLFLIRYLPVHVTFINALFGSTRISTRNFFITCVFILPEWLIQVYTGYMATSIKTMGNNSPDIFRIISFVISILAVLYLNRIAFKVIKENKLKNEEDAVIEQP
jgi:uncharacterized membrane protein YdjX (TVP38/TMEM64 family)